jgi:hypothetical protein
MPLTACLRRTLGRPTAVLLAMTCLILSAISASAVGAPSRHTHSTARSGSSEPIATTARTLPRPLRTAAKRATQADRALVSKAKALKRCLSRHQTHPKKCSTARRAVQRAGSKLAGAERTLARIARTSGKAASSSGAGGDSSRRAPNLTVSGQALTWARVARIQTYVLLRKVPGQADQYSVIRGTSVTSPPVPGVTVHYSVRTTANGSAWSTEKSITYAPAIKTTDRQAAPALAVSGQTLTWNAIAHVGTYVLATQAPGQAVQYSVVSGTSTTPPSVPGVTVRYSIRTAVNGSAWSPEVSISYPATVTTTPPPPPVSGGGSTTGFEMGIVPESMANTEPGIIQQLGAHSVRMEFEIGVPASQLASTVEGYARDGIRVVPLAGFDNTLPTSAQARNLANWAAEFGPGGSFWQGKSFPTGTAMTAIEFGNETSYTYQFSDNSTEAVAARAQTYALRLKEAYEAIHAVNPNVGILAQADDGDTGSSTWVDNMFKAVPNLASIVAGWTVHPYGPEPGWKSRIDALVAQTQAEGAPSSIPIYVTEWGLATDNGRCLSDNYGWNRCMTYQEAATALGSTVAAMRARYGSRLHAFYLYQAQDQGPSGTSTNREEYFGALQNDGASKGPYTAEVQSLESANP